MTNTQAPAQTPATPTPTISVCHQLGATKPHDLCRGPLLDARYGTVIIATITTANRFAIWLRAVQGRDGRGAPVAAELGAVLDNLALTDPGAAAELRATGYATVPRYRGPAGGPQQTSVDRFLSPQQHLLPCHGGVRF